MAEQQLCTESTSYANFSVHNMNFKSEKYLCSDINP